VTYLDDGAGSFAEVAAGSSGAAVTVIAVHGAITLHMVVVTSWRSEERRTKNERSS
jgi:hypothetical protein